MKIGLALSGGGVRAAAFHLGVLRKLNELNLLKDIDVISTVSGGSIIGAAYCLFKGNFPDFEAEMTNKLQKSIQLRIIFNWRMLLTILPSYSRTDVKSSVYTKLFFGKKKIGDLPKSPKLIINTIT